MLTVEVPHTGLMTSMSTLGASHEQPFDPLLTNHTGLGWKSTFLAVPKFLAVIMHPDIFE
jgi:hypothetical protein